MTAIARAFVALLLISLLAACGGASATITPTSAPAAGPAPTNRAAAAPTSAPAATAAPTQAPVSQAATKATPRADAAFPITIDHKYGSTKIVERPERIVTVGLTDHDALLALGVVPVGTTEWFGKHPSAVWPWAQDKLGGTQPELVGDADTISFEKIAALKPDLILALYAGLTEDDYKTLAQIAPTVAHPAGYVDYGIPWQELTRTVGRVIGQAQKADELVAGVEAHFAKVRSEHPEFVGARAVVATPYQGIWVYGPEDVRSRFLTALGFELPAGLVEITGKEFGGNLSMERADLLDADVIVWLDPKDAQGPLGGPLYASLKVHTQGREVLLDSYNDPLGGATSFVSVLSLPFLLDGLVPQLAAAVDGDPNTKVVSEVSKGSPALVGQASFAAMQLTQGQRIVTHAAGETNEPVYPQLKDRA